MESFELLIWEEPSESHGVLIVNFEQRFDRYADWIALSQHYCVDAPLYQGDKE